MRYLLLVATLLSATAIDARTGLKRFDPTCARPSGRHADGPATIRPRKLGEMPPAKQYLAVWRQIDGCPRPVVLRQVQPLR